MFRLISVLIFFAVLTTTATVLAEPRRPLVGLVFGLEPVILNLQIDFI